MTNAKTLELKIEDITYLFKVTELKDSSMLSLDDYPGGYVFTRYFKSSKWLKFAKWVDRIILRNKHIDRRKGQWVEIKWSNKKVINYEFVTVGRIMTKEQAAANVASLAVLFCYYRKENILDELPIEVKVHFNTVLDYNQYIYNKITDHSINSSVMSSFRICAAIRESREINNTNGLMH